MGAKSILASFVQFKRADRELATAHLRQLPKKAYKSRGIFSCQDIALHFVRPESISEATVSKAGRPQCFAPADRLRHHRR